jgi:carboxymethylenebutenolidase
MYDSRMTSTEVTVSTPDGEMLLHDCRSSTDARAAIVVIQEGFGVDPYIRAVADRFAGVGYRAVAPHLFHRTGDPTLGYDDPRLAFPHIRALTAEDLRQDLDATLGYLADQGIEAKRVAVVGFSMGGSVVIALSTLFELGGAVSYCGGGGGGLTQPRLFGLPPLIEVSREMKTPWLGHFGDLDEYVPVDEVEQLRAAAACSGVPTEVIRHPEAGHDFYCSARPDAYHAAAAERAWQRDLEFFAKHLG